MHHLAPMYVPREKQLHLTLDRTRHLRCERSFSQPEAALGLAARLAKARNADFLDGDSH